MRSRLSTPSWFCRGSRATSSPYLLPAFLLGLVSSATKILSGGYAAARAGVGGPGRLRAGAALVARGEFSIVIAGLAASAGYTEVGPLASAYVVLMGVAGPLVARFADQVHTSFRRGRAGTPSPVPDGGSET